jgi:CubicO group peptidase (beta-lactamase class C family)
VIARKLIWPAVLLLIAGLIAAAIHTRPDLALRVATNVVAHNVCAKTFVSGLDPQTSFAEIADRDGIRRLRWLLRYTIERTKGLATASVAGLFESRAAFHEGFGCVMLLGPEPYLLKVDVTSLKGKEPSLLPDIAGPDIVVPSDPKLQAALDHAFEEPTQPPFRRTKAVVVVRDGTVIAERYARGVGIHTALPGYSLTKSVVNALIGVLTQQGLVTPSLPAAIPEWRGATDPRREIEIEHLMRMTSGLSLDETNTGFDASSRMYLQNDMAGYAVQAKLIAPIGSRWAYSSPTTQLLARIIRDAAGGPEQSLRLAWRELFNPLGMRDVTLEFDGSGTLQGSSFMLATARDWARFGLLYLNDGLVGGKRLLHEDWVDLSAAATLGTDYGAGFWTNRSEHPHAKGRVALGIPRDAFFASGDLGQRIVILPTQGMVIVRLGDAVDPTGDIRGLGKLVREVIEAVQ